MSHQAKKLASDWFDSWSIMDPNKSQSGPHCYDFYFQKPLALLRYSWFCRKFVHIEINARMLEIQSLRKECAVWEPKKPEIYNFDMESVLTAKVFRTNRLILDQNRKNRLSEHWPFINTQNAPLTAIINGLGRFVKQAIRCHFLHRCCNRHSTCSYSSQTKKAYLSLWTAQVCISVYCQGQNSVAFTTTFSPEITDFLVQVNNKRSLAFSLMTASVVSAILSMTGVQSSLPVEDRRLSMAPFMMSIPEDKIEQRDREWHNSLQDVWCVLMHVGVSTFRFTYGARDRRHTQIQHMKLLHQLSLWHGKLCRQKKHTLKYVQTAVAHQGPHVISRLTMRMKHFVVLTWLGHDKYIHTQACRISAVKPRFQGVCEWQWPAGRIEWHSRWSNILYHMHFNQQGG